MPRTERCGWLSVLLLGLAAAAPAQYSQQGSKLVVGGYVGSPAAGTSVAISADGNTAIVGGPFDNQEAGAAWVFVRSNGNWVQQGGKLVSSDTVGVAAQGTSVAISADGNTAVVGGMNDNDGTGAFWPYTRTNGVWTQQGPRRWGTVLLGIAHQGVSISLSADGNTALLGGDLDSGQTGAAWVFTRTNGVWSLVPVKLVGTGSAGQSHQGASVALSSDGNTAILGAPGDSNGTGAAFVFVRANNVWQQQAKLTGTLGFSGGAFGTAVALSADGSTAAVGGSGDNNNSGAVWVFARANGTWTQQGSKLTGTDPAASRYLGQSVAITGDGNTIIAGGPGGQANLFGGSQAIGAVWVFTRASGVWSQSGAEFSGFGTAGGSALQGTSVAVTPDGTTALAGGPADNGSLGAVWAFTRPAPPSPPVITSQPISATVPSGQTASLTVVAGGAAPLSYQWYQGSTGNTSAPVGQNSPTLVTPILTATTNFWVRVSNPYGTLDSSTATLTVGPGGPVITQVVSVANQSTTIAPNTFVEIHGTNLAPAGDVRAWQGSDFVNNQLPLQLDAVTVTVNGKSAFVEYISPTQVNILTPPDPIQGTVQLLMSSGGKNSAPVTVTAQPIEPAFFVFQGQSYIAAEHTNGAYLAPTSLFPGASPAKPGETIVLYGSGFGPTSPPVVSGSLSQTGVLTTPPVIIIGGVPATVLFAGLVVSVPGEFQFNVVVPSTVPDGDNIVTAVYAGLSTQTGLLIPVQR